MMTKPPNSIETFLSRVEKTDYCWLWRGTIDADGYGRFHMMNKNWRAHRLAYHTWVEELTSPHQVVMHTCDNPPCVNPDHLRKGTNTDNIRDMYDKGRNYKITGANNPMAKLTEYQVDKIRTLHAAGFSQHDLSLTFNVSRAQIRNILTGKHWKVVDSSEVVK